MSKKKPVKQIQILPKYDESPEYGGIINFASNGVVDEMSAFRYGFRLGWQTLFWEIQARKDGT